MLRKGLEVLVVSPVPFVPEPMQNTPERKAYRQLRRATMLDGIPVYYPRYFCLPWQHAYGFSTLSFTRGIRGLVKTLAEGHRVELIHAHCATPDGYAAVTLGEELGLPVICSLRGSEINEYPYESSLTFRLTRDTLTRARRILAVSGALARKAQECAGQHIPIGIIHNGCDTHAFSPSPRSRAEARSSLGVGPSDILLLFAGTMVRTKGIFELAGAFSRLARQRRHLRLAMVGEGRERVGVENALRLAGVADRVSTHGLVVHDRMAPFFNAADIFVLPTYAEGFPNVVKEAMACAVPVLTTSVGGIPEVIEDGANGLLVAPRDAAALEGALERLVDDAGLRRRLGDNGRRTVAQRFSWDSSAEALQEEYAAAIQGWPFKQAPAARVRPEGAF